MAEETLPGSEIQIYQSDDGTTHLDVRLEDETVWLNQAQLAELYGTSRPNITSHIKNIFEEAELEEEVVCKDFLHTTEHGAMPGRTQSRLVRFYNLDKIISLGYRVNSKAATRFRQWASQRLHEYIVKGFTMDDERLKGNGGGAYWKELLDRIRDIRSSEKALYRQVLDLYATSIDYDPKSAESVRFFKIVQNKLHYAVNRQTAAELINTRADASKDFMGLTTFQGALPTLNEAKIAKNYLTQDELFVLNRLVSAFFDLAEVRAKEHTAMRMSDWVAELDQFAAIYGKGVLPDAGKVTHTQAERKAIAEYRTYQARTLSPVEKSYLDQIKALAQQAEKQSKGEVDA
ncbi:MAG: virulence RhuM family protein [Propionibacteriaceae bacterium]|jgi:hypothetical protein|nr:virulence RhuM family protein [Propionibacteriaceae bacterium]